MGRAMGSCMCLASPRSLFLLSLEGIASSTPQSPPTAWSTAGARSSVAVFGSDIDKRWHGSGSGNAGKQTALHSLFASPLVAHR